ncbi:DUF1697 domain-containing protein [Sphingomonas sp.]|uniref:DUF1697 domain-containing protein n=1 Tax=Sphingomonas sp. TaxID=28214 RepID=UPI00286E8FCD|nr:DUF1697 domain-containing protein [Sphingomonas sp.]
MTSFVALLRAVNVAGTGKLPMAQLKAIGEACDFSSVRTFIASGNLLFASDRDEPEVAALLEDRLEAFAGKRIPIFVRSAAEMAEVAARNPFTDDKPSRVMAHFIAEPPTDAMLAEAKDVAGERMALGPRAIYVSYGEGIGKTRLKLPAVRHGTARNINSVAKIASLLA